MIGLLALATVAATAPAPLAITFAPPLDRPVVYEVADTRTVRGKELHFTTTRQFRFARAGEGFRLESSVTALGTDAPPSIAIPFTTALNALRRHAVAASLDADGVPLEIEDLDARWAEFVAAIDTQASEIRRLTPGDASRIATAEGYAKLLAAMPVEQRSAMLLEGTSDVFGFATPLLAPGESKAYSTAAAAPTGQPVGLSGTISMAASDPGTARFVVATESAQADMAAAAQAMLVKLTADLAPKQRLRLEAAAKAIADSIMVQRLTVVVSRRTGLVLTAERETALRGSDGAETLVEREQVRQIAPVL